MAATPLLDLTRALTTDPATKAAFREDPDGFLAAHGHPDLTAADLAGALAHVADALPAPLALALEGLAQAGDGLVDLLDGVAGIDQGQALETWEALIGAEPGPHDLDDLDDLMDPADLDAGVGGFAPADEAIEDPADGHGGDADDAEGGFAAADDHDLGGFAPAHDDLHDAPGGFAAAVAPDEDLDDATFGAGADAGRAAPKTLVDLEEHAGPAAPPADWDGDRDHLGTLDPFGGPDEPLGDPLLEDDLHDDPAADLDDL